MTFEKIMCIIKRKNKKPKDTNLRLEELLRKYDNDFELLEMLLLIQEENVNNKMYVEENILDLGIRKAYDKLIHRIYKTERRM